jgi:hypothetical protein
VSEQATEQQPSAGAPVEEEASITDLASSGDITFALVEDLLAAEPDGSAAGEGGGTTGAPATGDGQPAPADQGAGAPAGQPAAPAAGGAGQPGVPDGAGEPAGAPAGDGDAAAADATAAVLGTERPAEWTRDASELIPKLGEAATALEERTLQGFQSEEREAVEKEFPKYFEALAKHPRELVGVEVPKPGTDRTEVLRDSADAQEWQEATKALLAREIVDRAERRMEENSGYLQTLHQSIELFQNNVDLIPGTKQFDVDLANRVAQVLEPYAVRVNGKLHGYSIPVQPMVNQIRTALTQERSAAPAAPTPVAGAAPEGAPAGGVSTPPPADPPQAGITSKAGQSDEGKEHFGTLFGTLGLPDFTI